MLREGAIRIARKLCDEENFKSKNDEMDTRIEDKNIRNDTNEQVQNARDIGSIDEIDGINELFNNDDLGTNSNEKAFGEEILSRNDQDTVDHNMFPKVYYISLLATDAQNTRARGVPEKAYYLFDIKCEMELEAYGIRFISAQDLVLHYDLNESDPQKARNKEGDQETPYHTIQNRGKIIPTVIKHDGHPNIYTLAERFIEDAERESPGGFYFFDEVPLIKGSN